MKTYFQHINEGIRTTVAGMKLTFRHLWAARTRRSNNNIRENDYFKEQTGMVTLQYPFETMPIPDNGRYRLHNEMDDCIVCDKCAKVCPVDCIDIEPIKATSEVGKASDGSPIRLYAAKFDIDMAKCCYCGLCTTVCPTECLTMTKTFDYSEFDVRDMNYHYANLSPEQAAEKKSLYEQFLKEKEELKKSPQSTVNSSQSADRYAGAAQSADAQSADAQSAEGGISLGSEQLATSTPTPKPAFRPTVKPSIPKTEEVQSVENKETPKPKPVFVPKKPASEQSAEEKPIQHEAPVGGTEAKPKPVFKPTKPKTVMDEQPVPVESTRPEQEETTAIQPESTARPKPVFKPTMKPKSVEEKAEEVAKVVDFQPEPASRPKPVFKPTMKPKSVEETDRVTDSPPEPTLSKENTDSGEVKPRPKPVFKPIMRPKKEE